MGCGARWIRICRRPEMLLEVDDLKVEFRSQRGTVHAVNGVSFAIEEGEALGVVGESGSGKTVTAMALMRLLQEPPARISGSVRFRGRDLLQLSRSEMRAVRGAEIAMIFQDPMSSLNPVLTVQRQITETLELHKDMEARRARTRAVELLELVGIADAPQRVRDYPHQFSGGMRQRVMIAMAIACDPKLLIADEPTTALDVTIQAQITDLVRRLRGEIRTAIMWISHDLGVVAGLCDRAHVMYAGHVVESGSVDEIFDDQRHPYTLGLLNSIPRLDASADRRLDPIKGQPPDLVNPPAGCPFQPRCPYAIDRCQEMPPLEPVAPGHAKACWVDLAGVAR
jgi:oligopeptide transport system ATP-binding protein